MIQQAIEHVGRLYVLYINRTYGRTGTLWEGRHKAGLVCAAEYLLACYRYIELNPVRAGMVVTPEQYRWSSYGWHAWGVPNDLVVDHVLYQQLSADLPVRQQAYRQLFTGHLEATALQVMREALTHNYPLGNDRFREAVELHLG